MINLCKFRNSTIRNSCQRSASVGSKVVSAPRRPTQLAATARRVTACFGFLFTLLFVLNLDARADVASKLGNQSVPAANEYELGPQDEIRVRVLEWRPSSDEIFAWEALNANYTIGPRFNLALPLIGRVSVVGFSTGQLATVIGKKLQTRMGLVLPPDVSVELVKYRPFYVVGAVEAPGEYSYRPGLDVLQAVSISGGLFRNNNVGMIRLERDIAITQGESALLARERDTLIARKARLEAELRGVNQIVFPQELTRRKDNASISEVMLQENLVFGARQKAYETQLRVLNELHKFLKKEIVSLNAQVKARERQTALLREEQRSIDALAAKRLARLSRVLDVKRDLATSEVENLRTQAQLSKTHQDVSRNEIAIVELKNSREGDLRTELQQSNNRLEEIARRAATLRTLLHEAQVIAPMRVAEQAQNAGIRPQYSIVRRADGEAVTLSASETTVLLPGDTLKVKLLLPTGGTSNRSTGLRFNPVTSWRQKKELWDTK